MPVAREQQAPVQEPDDHDQDDAGEEVALLEQLHRAQVVPVRELGEDRDATIDDGRREGNQDPVFSNLRLTHVYCSFRIGLYFIIVHRERSARVRSSLAHCSPRGIL